MSKRIMIVEDSLTQAYSARWLLEEAGYEVELAENGEVGLEKALADPPDLVVADILMPVMDGYEMTRRLKADPRTAAVPVLMLTAKDQPLDVIRGLEVGADHFITKPYDDDDLVARIRILFDRLDQAQGGHLPEQRELERFGQEIVVTGGREQMLQSLLQATSRILDCQAMALLSRSPDGDWPLFIMSFHSLEPSTVEQLGEAMANNLARLGEGAAVPAGRHSGIDLTGFGTDVPIRPVRSTNGGRASADTESGEDLVVMEREGDLLQSFLHAPIIVEGQVTGLIGVFSARPGTFDLQHVRFLFDMGQEAAQALSRIRAG
jgi:DNA-binding response OmpR family regulator